MSSNFACNFIVSDNMYYNKEINWCLIMKAEAASAFVGGERIAPDEEMLVLSKSDMNLSFTYGVWRGLVYNYLAMCIKTFLEVPV